eukprot:TRINITY_DN1312_c0_g1_i16.p1 TRINITY_DN1312_c0_g1~~TRINITY_DN1312_c0_g1_i16.p1  ORF type:complete len:121 (+),score=30.35 TRINITY_DN1312_c0_g1_i16:49-363(+)
MCIRDRYKNMQMDFLSRLEPFIQMSGYMRAFALYHQGVLAVIESKVKGLSQNKKQLQSPFKRAALLIPQHAKKIVANMRSQPWRSHQSSFMLYNPMRERQNFVK